MPVLLALLEKEREEELVSMIILLVLQEKEEGERHPCGLHPRWLYPPCAEGEDLSSSSCSVSSYPFLVLRLNCLVSLDLAS